MAAALASLVGPSQAEAVALLQAGIAVRRSKPVCLGAYADYLAGLCLADRLARQPSEWTIARVAAAPAWPVFCRSGPAWTRPSWCSSGAFSSIAMARPPMPGFLRYPPPGWRRKSKLVAEFPRQPGRRRRVTAGAYFALAARVSLAGWAAWSQVESGTGCR